MNILISVDKNFQDKAETMLFSLRLAVKEKLDVYLLNHSLNDKDIYEFNQHLCSICHELALYVVEIKSTALDQLPITKQFSIEMYYRILAQFVLPSNLDRILWLDADIIIKKDITDFYNQSFDGKMYVVCPDARQKAKDVVECKQKLSLPDDYQYFNSGVMLMNLELLRKETNQGAIIETCYNLQGLIKYPDQDILNYLYADQVKYDDWKKYNYLLNGVNRLPQNEIKDIAILHYAGLKKPWNAYLSRIAYLIGRLPHKLKDVLL